jgi:hypothetical protein
MAELKSLQGEESRLPAVVSASKTPSTRAGSAAVSRRSAITAALASLAPLAIEIIYGLTQKWFSDATGSGAVSRIPGERGVVNSGQTMASSQPSGTARSHWRWRGGRA